MTEEQTLVPPFIHDGGCCWVANATALPSGDSTDQLFPSPLRLFENGRELGPPHTLHEEIRRVGNGRFSHWCDRVFFSAHDNTDPNTNGRTYTASLSRVMRQRAMIKPVDEAVEHAIGVVRVWTSHLHGGGAVLNGAHVAEIGPGSHMGGMLALAALGARCYAIDRISHQWDEQWHPALVEGLIRRAAELPGPLQSDRLESCVRAGSFEPAVTFLSGQIEDAVGNCILDLSFSSSAFEHFADVGSALRTLHQLSRIGGLGVHCVDLRDHRNFERPLEFLLMSDEAFEAIHGDTIYRYEIGNRLRPSEILKAADDAGFFASRFIGGLRTPDAYRDDILAHLSASSSRFRNDDLTFLNGVLRFVKA